MAKKQISLYGAALFITLGLSLAVFFASARPAVASGSVKSYVCKKDADYKLPVVRVGIVGDGTNKVTVVNCAGSGYDLLGAGGVPRSSAGAVAKIELDCPGTLIPHLSTSGDKKRWFCGEVAATADIACKVNGAACPAIVAAEAKDDKKSLDAKCDSLGVEDCLAQNPIIRDVNVLINFLAGMVILVVIGSLIFAGILYSSSGDNPQQVTQAKKRILNSLIALITFALTYALLQFLIPGGIF